VPVSPRAAQGNAGLQCRGHDPVEDGSPPAFSCLRRRARLAFPIFNFPFLAWVSLAVLILAVLNETPRYAFLLGWVQGVAFYALKRSLVLLA